MLDLVRTRLACWQSRFLSMGGRLVLIQSVLNYIPIYRMSLTILPEDIKRKFHGFFSRFLWGGFKDKQKIHLVNWEMIVSPVS